MASPAPKSPEQSDKNKKYDRQLRLWGDEGQAALEGAHVCLINATGVGTEIMKALVLPGIGAFTIVDGSKVQPQSVEVNFFLDSECIGKPQAQVTSQLLLELNPDVRGDYVDEDIEQVLENNADFFNNFTLVIGTALTERNLMKISKMLWELDIPFLHCRSYGWIGYIRVQIKEHTVIESHPDNQNPDLRLDKPFPSLKKHCDSIDLNKMDLKDHAHIPYLIILYKYLQVWKDEAGKDFPRTYKEKEKLREIIRDGKLKNEDGVPEDEENFEEAIKAVNSVITESKIPSHIKEIFDDNLCVNLTSKSQPFWILAKAVRDFVENEGQGCLPLRGAVPDMTAETGQYIALQKIYRNQANKDAEIVYRRVQQLLHELNQPTDTISEADTRKFCKHASQLSLTRGTSIVDEYQGRNSHLQNIVCELEPPDSMLLYYIMLRGVDRFQLEHNSYPGELNDQIEPDIVKLKCCIGKLLGEWGSTPFSKDDYVHEICRYGACELHSVSSFVGGCAAQEAIKFITHQYKPIHNTFIYDAITSSTATFSF